MRSLTKRVHDRLSTWSLSGDARSVLRAGLTYLSPAKLRRIERELANVREVAGDFAEFGVALGGSAIIIAKQAKDRRFHGFDVFGMIPEPTSPKDDQRSKNRYQTIAQGESQGLKGQLYYGYRLDLFDEVKARFAAHGVPVGAKIILHKGLFENTVSKASLGRLAFVHIDCDWYDPVSYCLSTVADRLGVGGVIVVDDYHDYGGCRIAVDEFLMRRSDFTFEDGPNPILRKRI